MTGGQDAAGAMQVPELTRIARGRGRQADHRVTDEPDKYGEGRRAGRRASRSGTATGSTRRSACCATSPGVTVLVYDQRCAAEKRRLRKRGKLPDPATRVFINEAVCEGCGDCGVKSNCLSVQPVETEFGRKTQIHQSSCNKDYSCLRGRLPVVPHRGAARRAPEEGADAPSRSSASCPSRCCGCPREANVFMMGIGGTGVVTVNQILGTAALLDGKHVRGLDQTGLSQKGGPVVSHLKIADAGARGLQQDRGRRRPTATWASTSWWRPRPQNLDHARPDQTIAVVSTSQVPTGAMVTSHRGALPRGQRSLASDQPGDPQGRERLPRRPRAGRAALRRSHGGQHDRAGRGLPGGRHRR